jgi:hypothetical protein
VIDVREQEKNAFGSIRFNSESVSNENDESDLQFGKHNEERI